MPESSTSKVSGIRGRLRNHKRLFGLIGHVPPAEAEAAYHQQTRDLAMAA